MKPLKTLLQPLGKPFGKPFKAKVQGSPKATSTLRATAPPEHRRSRHCCDLPRRREDETSSGVESKRWRGVKRNVFFLKGSSNVFFVLKVFWSFKGWTVYCFFIHFLLGVLLLRGFRRNSVWSFFFFFSLPYPASTICQKRKQGVGIAKRACYF